MHRIFPLAAVPFFLSSGTKAREERRKGEEGGYSYTIGGLRGGEGEELENLRT